MTRHFLHLTDLTSEELRAVFSLAATLKRQARDGVAHPLLRGKTMAMLFQKPSARTRISFETAMFQLGGHALYLSPADIGMGTREAVKDVARVLSGYNDLIMARVFAHDHVTELAEFATVPVINGLSDFNHPCQVLADLMTVEERRGSLEDLTVTFVGDGNNVCNSWLEAACRIPMTVRIACPDGHEPDAALFARVNASGSSRAEIARDARRAAVGADVIYTDVWASMGQETEAESRRAIFRPYQVTEKVMRAAGEKALFLHCLPAHRGEEVTDGVMEGPHSVVFEEAENRLHAQKALMVFLVEGRA